MIYKWIIGGVCGLIYFFITILIDIVISGGWRAYCDMCGFIVYTLNLPGAMLADSHAIPALLRSSDIFHILVISIVNFAIGALVAVFVQLLFKALRKR